MIIFQLLTISRFDSFHLGRAPLALVVVVVVIVAAAKSFAFVFLVGVEFGAVNRLHVLAK